MIILPLHAYTYVHANINYKTSTNCLLMMAEGAMPGRQDCQPLDASLMDWELTKGGRQGPDHYKNGANIKVGRVHLQAFIFLLSLLSQIRYHI